MLPFVALHGYQFNDTRLASSWGAGGGALHSLLRFLARETERTRDENVFLASRSLSRHPVLLLRHSRWRGPQRRGRRPDPSLPCAMRGEGPPSRPGGSVLFSMATLTRTPLFFFAGLFVLAHVPGRSRASSNSRPWARTEARGPQAGPVRHGRRALGIARRWLQRTGSAA